MTRRDVRTKILFEAGNVVFYFTCRGMSATYFVGSIEDWNAYSKRSKQILIRSAKDDFILEHKNEG